MVCQAKEGRFFPSLGQCGKFSGLFSLWRFQAVLKRKKSCRVTKMNFNFSLGVWSGFNLQALPDGVESKTVLGYGINLFNFGYSLLMGAGTSIHSFSHPLKQTNQTNKSRALGVKCKLTMAHEIFQSSLDEKSLENSGEKPPKK
jgi:hypothetical protein